MTRWEKIGFVEGGGNSNSIIEYSFTDTKLFGGSKFIYRLKQIDNEEHLATQMKLMLR